MRIRAITTIVSSPGMTLLLVVPLLAAILSISIGIFTLTFGEIRISGEIEDSFLAVYAADQGLERGLYLDFTKGTINCSGANCYVENWILPATTGASPSGYTMRISKTGSVTAMTIVGQYRCPGTVGQGVACGTDTLRIVQRGFEVSY